MRWYWFDMGGDQVGGFEFEADEINAFAETDCHKLQLFTANRLLHQLIQRAILAHFLQALVEAL